MVSPDFLKKGDKIAIVAPARKVSELEMMPAIKKLSDWGLQVILGKNLFGVNNQYSGTDEERIADFQEMLDDKSIKAIISARGGYGSIRLIEKLRFDHFFENPKWIIGYSDITIFHSFLHVNNTQSIHATMPINFPVDGSDNESTESLKNTLFGKKITYNLPVSEWNRTGKSEGIIVGGNLSILYSLGGTALEIDTRNKILFIEDLDEYFYHIDRMMMTLKLRGLLKNLKGLIIGGLSDMRDNTIPFGKTAEQIVLDAVSEYVFPVCFNFPAGHINPNISILMGQSISLSVEEKTVKISSC